MKIQKFTDITLSDFRVAYEKPDDYLYNAYITTWKNAKNPPSKERILEMAIKGQLNPAPVNGLRLSFKVNNMSRVCLAHLTRHNWIFNCESHMCDPLTERTYIVPTKYINDERVINLLKESDKLYEEFLAEEILPRDARYMLPMAVGITCFVDLSLKDLKVAALMRLENAVSDEINYVIRLIRYELIKLGGFYEQYAETIDCLGALQKKRLHVDDELGNTLNRFGEREDLPYKFDGLNSSWWLDLKELPDYLLLDGEKEMIERLAKKQ